MKLAQEQDFFLNTAKSAVVCLTIFLLTVIALASCNKRSITELGLSESELFREDIENTTIVPDLATAKSTLTREVLGPLGANAGATLEKRYVTENGAGIEDGSNWMNAWAATNLRNGITNVRDATANKVYLILIAGGTYKPAYGSSATRGDSFNMKNHVAIMGGFQTNGGWERTGTTVFSGDIGTAGNTADNSYHVFSNANTVLDNTHLYGVTITKGNANGTLSYGALGSGGGMYNSYVSPILTRVVFTENNAGSGGGMYNNYGSPVLSNTVFARNTVTTGGGGMYNFGNLSSPLLKGVVFTENNADSGGGMVNNGAPFPVLLDVVFNNNRAGLSGGALKNNYSSTIIIGAVFKDNRAKTGGVIHSDNDAVDGPFILNAIFSGNTADDGDIAVRTLYIPGVASKENITIAGSVLGINLAHATNAIVPVESTAQELEISYHHLRNTPAAKFGADVTSGGLTYPSIQAYPNVMINLGVYVRRSGNTYYFSDDNENWYTSFLTTGGWGTTATLPAGTENMTATDITGKTVTGRPDAGVNEF